MRQDMREDVAETPNPDAWDNCEPGGLQGLEGQRQHGSACYVKHAKIWGMNDWEDGSGWEDRYGGRGAGLQSQRPQDLNYPSAMATLQADE